MRNSSLVECPGADNVARLKHRTEAVDGFAADRRTCFVRKSERGVEEGEADHGRGAFSGQRSQTGRTGGAQRSENAGMSSEIRVRTTDTESLRVPGQRQTTQGQSGPKPRTS